MAEIVWTEPPLSDLDAIADCIALDDSQAARRWVQRVFKHLELLAHHPRMGSKPHELKGGRYRQIVEPPCRVFYRQEQNRVYVLCVMRSERVLRPGMLAAPNKKQPRSEHLEERA